MRSHDVVSVQAGMLGSMAVLLESQTNDIVQSLRDEHDPNGRALTDYAGAMIDSGNVDGLSQDIARLKRGEALRNGPEAEQAATSGLADSESRYTATVGYEDEVARFRTESKNRYDEPVFANAERLGYFVGTVAAAFANRIDSQNRGPKELGKLIGVLNGGVGTMAEVSTQPLSDRRAEALWVVMEDIELAAYPRDADDRRYTGKAGTDEYSKILKEVYSKNCRINLFCFSYFNRL